MIPSSLETNSADVSSVQQMQPGPKPLSVPQIVVWPFFNSKERRLRALWRLLLQIVLAAILILIPYLALAAITFTLEDPELLESEILAGVIQSIAFAVATLVCFVMLDRRPAWGRIGKEWVRNLILGLMLGAVAMTIIMLVEYSLGWIDIVSFGAAPKTSWIRLLGLLMIYLLLFTAVAIGEESLSRAYQLKNISEGLSFLGPVWASLSAIVVTSTIFALLHWFNPNSNLVSTLGILAAGILLAMARIFTGSLATPIGIHLTWNFFQGPIFGFPVSGNSFPETLFVISQRGPDVWTGGAFGPEAGLLGTVVIVLMLVALWFWAKFSQRSIPIEIIKLAHYKPRCRPRRLSPSLAAEPALALSAPMQEVLIERERLPENSDN